VHVHQLIAREARSHRIDEVTVWRVVLSAEILIRHSAERQIHATLHFLGVKLALHL
jgi:hypothetical protein